MKYLVVLLVLVLATSAFGLEKKAYQMREDFGTEELGDWALQYYYYIPCPTYSWFWAFTGWTTGDILGMCFQIGDQGTGCWEPVDPYNCHTIQMLRILDFAGYGTIYPDLFAVRFDVWCCAASMNPLMHICDVTVSGTHFGWNYIPFPDTCCVTPCAMVWPPPAYPRVIITASMVGLLGSYPAWGCDNISTALEQGCVMHDLCCYPVYWPRMCPVACAMPTFPEFTHSSYFGTYFWEYGPPGLCFCDGRDTTPSCTQFGAIELAWRIYLDCLGPTGVEPSKWGDIKGMFQ
jgi:hypothetical protein